MGDTPPNQSQQTEIAALREQLATAQERYELVFQSVPTGWGYHEIVLDAAGEPIDYVFLEVNEAFESYTGLRRADILGQRVTEVIPGIEAAEPNLIALYGKVALGGDREQLDVYFAPFDRWYRVTVFSPKRRFFVCMFAEVTEQKRTEQELRDHQSHLARNVEARTAELLRTRETLTQQARELLEVATPVLQIWEGMVVAPLIGTLDSQRAQQLMERLLETIVGTRSEVALIDITGVPVVDTQTAQAIIETTSAARLLGARVILTGVRPAIARTLVHLGIDLSGIDTRATLEGGLRVGLGVLGLSVGKS